jgi:hypothetical protein
MLGGQPRQEFCSNSLELIVDRFPRITETIIFRLQLSLGHFSQRRNARIPLDVLSYRPQPSK